MTPRAVGVAAALVSLSTTAATTATVVLAIGADRSISASQRLGEQHPAVAALAVVGLVGPVAMLLTALGGRRARWWFAALAALVAAAEVALAARYAGPAPDWVLVAVGVQVLVLAVAAGVVAAA